MAQEKYEAPKVEQQNETSIIRAVRRYQEFGLSVVPLVKGKKVPPFLEWQKRTFASDEFKSDNNVGVKTDKIVDIDIDHSSVLALSEILGISPLAPRFGRKSRRMSHYIVRAPGSKYIAFTSAWQKRMEDGRQKAVGLLEIRCGVGHQTAFPPSIHKSGEPVEWEQDLPATFDEIPEMDPIELRRRAGVVAFLADLQPKFVAGDHNRLFLPICGSLFFANFEPSEIEEYMRVFIEADENPTTELRDRVKSIPGQFEKFQSGEAVYGLPNLCQELGLPEAERVWRRWLIGSSRTSQTKKVAQYKYLMDVLRSDPQIMDCFAYDEMTGRPALIRALPSSIMPFTKRRHLSDIDVSTIMEYLQTSHPNIQSWKALDRAVEHRSRENSYHPVKEYWEKLEWDGTPRLDTLFTTYCGSDDNPPYVKLVGRMWMISMVARIYNPGCQVDYMIVLEGQQGVKKTTFFRILGGEWYREGMFKVQDEKSGVEQTLGALICEFSEMITHRKSEDAFLKAWITRTEDHYRKPWGHFPETVKRQFVLAGTTNEDDYLRDVTGNRRYWPISVTKVDAELLTADRDQLFAEAIVAYQNGEKWWPSERDELELIDPQQRSRMQEDEAWGSNIRSYVDSPDYALVEGGRREMVRPRKIEVTISEIALNVLHLEMRELSDTRIQRRIGDNLRHLGFVRRKHNGDKRGRTWVRASNIVERSDGRKYVVEDMLPL